MSAADWVDATVPEVVDVDDLATSNHVMVHTYGDRVLLNCSGDAAQHLAGVLARATRPAAGIVAPGDVGLWNHVFVKLIWAACQPAASGVNVDLDDPLPYQLISVVAPQRQPQGGDDL